MTLQLTGAWTLVVALLTIMLGRGLNHWFPPLERSNIPPAVSAGLLLSLLLRGRSEPASALTPAELQEQG
jgi:Na+/glutamate symporter